MRKVGHGIRQIHRRQHCNNIQPTISITTLTRNSSRDEITRKWRLLLFTYLRLCTNQSVKCARKHDVNQSLITERKCKLAFLLQVWTRCDRVIMIARWTEQTCHIHRSCLMLLRQAAMLAPYWHRNSVCLSVCLSLPIQWSWHSELMYNITVQRL